MRFFALLCALPVCALAQSDSAVALDSMSVPALVTRATAFSAAGRPRDAASAYRRALALKPDYPGAANAAIGQFWRAGYYDEAFRWGKRQATLEPTNTSVLWNYQVAAAFLIEPTLAESLMVRALEVNPRYVTAHGELAFLALYSGRIGDAVHHMDAAYAVDTNSALTRGGLAQMLIPAGQAARARDLLAPIVSRDSNATAYGGRSILSIYGWALQESGDAVGAARAFAAALERLNRRRNAGVTTYQLYREMAAVQALQGDRAAAIASLTSAADAGMHTYATWELSDPMFASLRGDARLNALVERMRADTRRMRVAAGLESSATASQQGLPTATPERSGLSTAALRRVDAQLRAWVDSGKVAGIVGVVIRHGRIAYVTNAGSLDSAGAPIAADAVFRMYSMTKPIASTAVMQLVEAGKVRLSDPVSKYVPAFANTKVFVGGSAAQPRLAPLARPITIADLLTHTSGLTYGVFGNSPVDSLYMRANMLGSQYTLAQFADSIAKLPLLFQPGTRFNYGLSIDVLGRVVEVASGMTFDAYLDSAIFRPLGMTSTAFHATPSMRARLTRVYTRGRTGKLLALGPNADEMYADSSRMLSGGAGLLSTIPDYARFAQMLLNGGELDGHRILKRETVEVMMRNHLPRKLTPIFATDPEPPGRNGFGYGGAVRLDSASAAMPGSAGTFRWSGYASTFFWIDRQNDLIGMLFTQFIPEPAIWSIDGEFQKLVYGAVTHE